jgi:hypothetical protein
VTATLGAAHPRPGAVSSAGQSACLTSRRSLVRAQHRPFCRDFVTGPFLSSHNLGSLAARRDRRYLAGSARRLATGIWPTRAGSFAASLLVARRATLRRSCGVVASALRWSVTRAHAKDPTKGHALQADLTFIRPSRFAVTRRWSALAVCGLGYAADEHGEVPQAGPRWLGRCQVGFATSSVVLSPRRTA